MVKNTSKVETVTMMPIRQSLVSFMALVEFILRIKEKDVEQMPDIAGSFKFLKEETRRFKQAALDRHEVTCLRAASIAAAAFWIAHKIGFDENIIGRTMDTLEKAEQENSTEPFKQPSN